MKPLTISDASQIALGLQDEIWRSSDARYDRRLHGDLLAAQGMTYPEIARLLGDAPRTVENWVRRFEEEGLSGLVEGERLGRPGRLTDEQTEEIGTALRQLPREIGVNVTLWDGKSLPVFIREHFGVSLCVRQCQRLFRHLGFRMRKPRPVIARADPARQGQHKKNSEP